MNKDLKIIQNKCNKLLIERKEIMLVQFNKTKRTMKAIINEKLLNIINIRDTIMFYKNRIKTYKEFIKQLKDLNTYKENANNGNS